MPSYLFSLGNSNDGPIGFCARITGATPEAALATLKEHLDAAMSGGGVEVIDEPLDYVTVYFNSDAVTVADIEEGETEDDND